MRKAKVAKIEDAGPRLVWDMTVPLDHSYVAEGFVNHNSSSSPNLQNQPNEPRRLYVSRWGSNGCIIQADYSQIELRVAACLSNDKTMLGVYKRAEDIHKKTMGHSWRMSIEEIDKLELAEPVVYKKRRTAAKRTNFSVIYGTTGLGLMNQLLSDGVQVTQEEADGFIAGFFDLYHRLAEWMEDVYKSIRRKKYALSPFGRRRHLPDIRSNDFKNVNRAKRQGPNAIIQSAASDMTLTSLILIGRALRKAKLKARLVLTVHDSIIVDAPKNEAVRVVKIMKRIMENLPRVASRIWGKKFDWSWVRCPIVAEFEIGHNWRDGVKIKSTDFDIDQVMAEATKLQKDNDDKLRKAYDEAAPIEEKVLRSEVVELVEDANADVYEPTVS